MTKQPQKIADEHEEQLRALLPTAERVHVQTVEYSETMLKVGFAAKLPDGSWITGEWEQGAV